MLMRPEINAENELSEDSSAADRAWISPCDGPWYMRRSLHIALLLAVLCCVKLVAETEIERQERQAGFRSLDPISQELQDRLGQNMMISLLAGLRGVVADFYWRDVTEAWMNEDWARMRSSAELTTMLQPNSDIFWGMSGWQYAYNVATSKRNDEKEPNKAVRLANERAWVLEGERVMLRGLKINPDSVYILTQLAQLHMEKYHDPIGSAEYYEKASLIPYTPEFLARLPGFVLSHAGKNDEALTYWRRLWARFPKHDEPDYDWPRIYREIKKLEVKLNVPLYQRLPESEKPAPIPPLPGAPPTAS